MNARSSVIWSQSGTLPTAGVRPRIVVPKPIVLAMSYGYAIILPLNLLLEDLG